MQDAIQQDSNARIQEAKQGVEQLKNANLTLSNQLATLQGEASKQQERAAKAERDLLELRQRMEPRELSEEQRKILTAALLRIPKMPVKIACILGDREGCPFAEQIKQVFVSCGWDVGGSVFQGAYDGNPTGLFLHILKKNPSAPPNLNDVPPSATAIQEAFFSIGLTLRGGFVDRIIPTGSIEILVGGKPQKHQ